LAAGSASAQTGGYPPPTTVLTCTPGNANAGSVTVGDTVTFTLCGDFTATATITVNGHAAGTKTAVNGAVTVVVTVASQTELVVNDPVDVAGQCGTNTVVATGPGTPGTSTGTFTLLCNVSTATTTSPVTSTGALAFTGARLLELLLAVAAAMIVLGTLLVRLQHRRRQDY
jgi:hypothetical protein